MKINATLEITYTVDAASQEEALASAVRQIDFGKAELVRASLSGFGNYIPISVYAERTGRESSYLRRRAERGRFPGAIKPGRNWYVPENAVLTDARVKSGKYAGSHAKYYARKDKKDDQEE